MLLYVYHSIIVRAIAQSGSPKMQLLGVYDEYLVEPQTQVLISLGVRRGMVVYGKDKLDEISLSASTKVCEIKDGWFKSYGGAEKAAPSTCQSPQKGEM